MFSKISKSFLVLLFSIFVFTSNMAFASVGEGISDVGILSSVPGKEAVIFIPGIMGSPLYNSSDDNFKMSERVWINRRKVSWFGDKHLDPLHLAENGFDPLSSDYNIKVSPLRNSNRNFEDEFDFNDEPLASYEGILRYLNDELNYNLT